MKFWSLMAGLMVVALLGSAVLACPMCVDSIPNNDAENPAGIAAGYNYSVYIMLLGFLGVLGLVARTLFKACRTAQ